MSENEGFLRRWSRLKQSDVRRDAALEAPAEPEVPAEPAPAAQGETEEPGAPETAAPPPPLPPVDTLGADSDYKPFLLPGVPAELKRLALRKAWSSDPAIAGFRGMAEYDWDYNAPGYASLLPTDDIKRLCENLFGSDRSEADGQGKRIEHSPEPALEPSSAADVASPPMEADTGALPNASTPNTELPGPLTSLPAAHHESGSNAPDSPGMADDVRPFHRNPSRDEKPLRVSCEVRSNRS
jgi:Protein of unknown function (DUF3306)